MPRIDRTLRKYRGTTFRPRPLAESIAAELLHDAAILGLNTSRLISDIRERFRCAHDTALAAVEIARASA